MPKTSIISVGIAQCAELCWQLRGLAGKRQVPNVRHALQHNIGLGGAAVVAAYRLGWPERVTRPASNQVPEHERSLSQTLAAAQYLATKQPAPKPTKHT